MPPNSDWKVDDKIFCNFCVCLIIFRSKETDIARLEEEYIALASKCEKAKEEANKTKEKIKWKMVRVDYI